MQWSRGGELLLPWVLTVPACEATSLMRVLNDPPDSSCPCVAAAVAANGVAAEETDWTGARSGAGGDDEAGNGENSLASDPLVLGVVGDPFAIGLLKVVM
jgi:hypothetical protein